MGSIKNDLHICSLFQVQKTLWKCNFSLYGLYNVSHVVKIITKHFRDLYFCLMFYHLPLFSLFVVRFIFVKIIYFDVYVVSIDVKINVNECLHFKLSKQLFQNWCDVKHTFLRYRQRNEKNSKEKYKEKEKR